MHSDRAWLLLRSCQELGYNIVGWRSSVDEEQVEVFDSLLGELTLLVLGLVETHNQCHAHALPDRNVVIWSERPVSVSHVEWSREGDKLARNNPVKISIFNFLKVLVFLNIEIIVIVPSKSNSVFKSLETMKICAAIGAVTHSCIPIRNELVVIWSERLPCLFCRLF